MGFPVVVVCLHDGRIGNRNAFKNMWLKRSGVMEWYPLNWDSAKRCGSPRARDLDKTYSTQLRRSAIASPDGARSVLALKHTSGSARPEPILHAELRRGLSQPAFVVQHGQEVVISAGPHVVMFEAALW